MMRSSTLGPALLSFALLACGSRVTALDARDGSSATDAATAVESGAPPTISCDAGTWCWQAPLPQGLPINAVFTVDAREAWAVGDRGTILHFANSQWSATPSPTNIDLQMMEGSSASDVWAWGYTRPTSGDPEYVLVHWDGAQWSRVALGSLPSLAGFTAGGADRVWAITRSTTEARVRRWNGSALIDGPALPAGNAAWSICASSTTTVWALAARSIGSDATRLFRWDGAAWSLVHEARAGSSERFSGAVRCAADGAAIVPYFTFDTGVQEVLVARGESVTRDRWPLGDNTGPALFQTPHGDVYAMNSSSALVWTGSGWERRFEFDNASVYSTRFDHLRDGTAGWLANGTPFFSVLAAGAWRADPTATTAALTTFATGTIENQRDPIAAFGDGIWAYRDGERWVRANTPVVTNGMVLSAIDSWGASANRVWLVGRAGAIAQYNIATQSITPAMIEDTTTETLNDIDGSDADTVWAVGDGATIYRLDAGRWTRFAPTVPLEIDGLRLGAMNLVAVDVKSATDVMVLGNDVAGGRFASVFYRWDGVAWSARMTFGNTISIFDRDPEGNVYFVDGNELKRRPRTGEDVVITTLDADSAKRVRAFGFNDLELHTNNEVGSALQQWEIDPGQLVRAFSTTAPTRFSDVIRGANNTLWALGGYGSVARFRAAP